MVEGKLRGHIYDLPENSELYLGRGATFDIVIDEDMVSRRHARILTFHDRIVLQDLNSTNGTSVNQQRIQGAHHLQLGDMLTVGTCVLEVIQAPQGGMAPPRPSSPSLVTNPGAAAGSTIGLQAESSVNEYGANYQDQAQMGYNPSAFRPSQAMPQHGGVPSVPTPPLSAQPNNYGNFGGAQNSPSAPRSAGYHQPHLPQQGGSFNGMASLSGSRPRMKSEVGSFPSADVADVLTLVERLIERRHDGVLALFDPEEREGSIYFRGGRLYFATYEDPHRVVDIPLAPLQCLIKLCCWSQGRFKVKNMSALPSFEQEMNEDSRSLIERVRHNCIEMNQLRAQLPPLNSSLSVSHPLNPLLTALTPDQLYLFQLALNQYDVRSLIECHPQGEREGITSLLFLLDQAYLKS